MDETMTTDANTSALLKLARLPPEKKALVMRALKGRRSEHLKSCVSIRRDKSVYPLSYGQERLLVAGELAPQSNNNNEGRAFRIRGPLDVRALRIAMEFVLRRHEILRSNYELTIAGFIQIVTAPSENPISETDLATLPPDRRNAMLERLLRATINAPFDLGRDRLLRILLIRLGGDETLLTIVAHHIVCDAWSFQVFMSEFKRAYEATVEGHELILPPLPIQYADYAAWQRERLTGPHHARLEAFWAAELANLPQVSLKADRARPLVERFRGDQIAIEFDQELTRTARAVALDHNVTLFMLMLSVFLVTVARFSRSTDVVVGTDTAGRTSTEFESLIGFFINHLPIRMNVELNSSFGSFLQDVRRKVLSIYDNQDLPFNLMPALMSGHPRQSPIFRSRFVLQGKPATLAALGPATTEVSVIPTHASKDDLFISLWSDNLKISGFAEYNSDIFDAATIIGVSRWFSTWTSRACSQPGATIEQINRLTDMESQAVLPGCAGK